MDKTDRDHLLYTVRRYDRYGVVFWVSAATCLVSTGFLIVLRMLRSETWWDVVFLCTTLLGCVGLVVSGSKIDEIAQFVREKGWDHG